MPLPHGPYTVHTPWAVAGDTAGRLCGEGLEQSAPAPLRRKGDEGQALAGGP